VPVVAGRRGQQWLALPTGGDDQGDAENDDRGNREREPQLPAFGRAP